MENIKSREDGTPVIVVPFKLRYLGYKQTIVVDEQNRTLEDIAQEPLPRALILVHQYAQMLESGRYSTVLELANLAPDIVKLIWGNRQSETLTLDKLRKGIPESWEEQRKLFLS